MTKLIEKTGDLFTTDAKAIGHGVNCAGLMGAGIAVAFKDRCPKMYEEYHQDCLLGVYKPGDAVPFYDEKNDQVIFNISSQDAPGPNARLIWLIKGVLKALEYCRRAKIKTLALPYIGAGIGGLDPEEVRKWLKECAESGPVDIELWKFE